MAIEHAPLFALETQFQTKDGRNNTGGWLKVFLAATDDPAVTYSDYNYTRNPEKIILDDDGRALVICDKSKAYRLEVYDMNGMLLWTEEPVFCSGTGGGGVSITRVISTDGSIAVSDSTAGSTTTYDIGMAPSDSVEFLEWGAAMRGNMHEGGIKPATLNAGTMEMGARGPKLLKDHYYHITNWMTVIPSGTGRNYETLTVTLQATDSTGWHSILIRDFDIDTSVSDSVTHEFSLDFIATEDCEIFWELSENVPDIGVVDYMAMNIHRIYSGINAVPGTCATKQWIAESYQPLSGMNSYVPYSAVNHNTEGHVTAINGSAIYGSLDSATVSSIASSVASSYTDSAFSSISAWTADLSSISSKADSSSLSAYQPVSAMSGYATEAYVDARVVDKLDATASSLFLTSLPDDLATTGDVASAVSGKLDKSASGEFYPMTGNPSGFLTAHQSLAGYATEQYVDSAVSSKLDTSAFASASGNFQTTGDYAYNSSLTAYYPASASGAFAPSGDYQTAGDYAFNSALSYKLDASASGNFVVNSSMTSWIPFSALDYSGTAISGIGGSSLAGMGGGGDYTGIYPVNVDNTTREISVDSMPLVTDSSMTSYASGDSSVIGVNLDIMSGKLDSSAQVVTATATRMYHNTAFLTSVNRAPISASLADDAVSATIAKVAHLDGADRIISSLPDSSTVSGIASSYAQSAASSKLDKTAQVVTATGSASAESDILPIYLVSSINGSALLPYGYSALSGYSAVWTYTYTSVTANSSQWNSVYNTVNSNSASWSGSPGGGSVVSPSGTILVTNGNEIEGTNSAVYTASGASGEGFDTLLTPNMFSIGPHMNLLTTGTVPGPGATLSMRLRDPAWTNIRIILSGRDLNYNYASASGYATANNAIAVIPMGGITGEISASAEQWLTFKSNSAGNAEMLTAHSDGGMIITTGVAELAWKSAVDNVTNTVATNSASWGQGGGGGGGSPTPFYATYGSTDYDAIWGAWNAGRLVYIQTTYPGDPCYFPLNMIDTKNDVASFGGMFNGTLYYFTNNTNTWTSGSK